MKPNYDYQAALIARCQDHLNDGGQVVLAAACAAGKTVMMTELVVNFLNKHPDQKVLILARGDTELRAQIARRLAADGRFTSVEILDKDSDLAPAVHVAIPHTKVIRSVSYGMIVIDEAHHYYFGKMVESILAANPDCVQLLLTASHWRFTRTKKMPVVTYAQQALLANGVIMSAAVKMFYTEQEFRTFNESGDLPEREVIENIDGVLARIKPRIKGKTLIACHSQKVARDVVKAFPGALLSTSEDDADSVAFKRFLTEKDCQILVVVFRGVIGFDMPELQTVVDLTCSQNVDRIYQLLGRVVRRFKGKKQYIKLAPKVQRDWYSHVMNGVMFLSDEKIYAQWDGRLDSIKMVVQKSASKGTKSGLRRGLTEFKAKIATWKEIPRLLQQAENDEDFEFTSLAKIRELSNGRDPEGKISAIWAFWDKHGTYPSASATDSKERWLGTHFSCYINPSHRSYRPAVVAESKRRGYVTIDERADRTIAAVWEFWEKHGRHPKQTANEPTERWLGRRFAAYLNPNSGCYRSAVVAESIRRGYPGAYKPVICNETAMYYPSTKAAAAGIGRSASTMSYHLRGLQKTAGGYTFRYATAAEIAAAANKT